MSKSIYISRQEISFIQKKNAIQSSIDALKYSAMPIAGMVSIITMLLTGQTLTPVNVFVLLSYIGVLKQGTCFRLATGFLSTYDAYVSLGRIEDFLLLNNLPGNAGDDCEEVTTKEKSRSAERMNCYKGRQSKINQVAAADTVEDLNRPISLCVSNLTYKKIDREDEFILQDIAFVARSKSLTVITGPVGSGKSTLLSAIAGEISEDTSETITYQGKLIYLPQTAWVFSGTIRENILFGKPYEGHKYARIIEACALTEDIQRFPDSDQTVVGERGEVLSGGQQARVSLARAVYADGDLYLLDDPLSAVDFKVGQHIFDKCIKDLLGEKTRLLTSHQEQHMKDAGEVIVLYKGRVLEKGRFTELHEKGVISSTVDPLNNMELSERFDWENEDITEDADKCEKMAPLTNEGNSLEIAQEDRTIGAVTCKLYWDYFRSGANSLVIIAVMCFCLFTQGEPWSAKRIL